MIVATGTMPWPAEIEGGDDAHVVDAWVVLRGEANVGGRVVITDWRCDWIGLGVAENLATDGCKVTLAVEDVDTIVAALGHRSVTTLSDALEDWSGDVLMAGDCLAPRTCEEAVLEGLKAGIAV